jgi:hypothetical protein
MQRRGNTRSLPLSGIFKGRMLVMASPITAAGRSRPLGTFPVMVRDDIASISTGAIVGVYVTISFHMQGQAAEQGDN